MTPAPTYSPGLEGIIAGETSISSVEDGLRYRGYPVTELGEQCTFDEVAYLLLYGDLPNKTQLNEFLVRVLLAHFDVVLSYDVGNGIRVEKGGEVFSTWPELSGP